MTEQHRYKLVPTSKASSMPFCFTRRYRLLKLTPRKNLEYLTQDAAKSFHRAESSFDLKKLGRLLKIVYRGSAPFSVPPKTNLDTSASQRRGMFPVEVDPSPHQQDL